MSTANERSETQHVKQEETRNVVLIVDDDNELVEMLSTYLEREGFAIESAARLDRARVAIDRRTPDLLVLDLMLPDGSGLDFCRTLRQSNARLPILILTARGDPMDRVLGLELGADDYLGKPFEPREFVARIRALLRRANLNADDTSGVIEWGRLRLDLVQRRAAIDGVELELTTIEFKLLRKLAENEGQAVDRDALAAAVQPGNYRPLPRAVDVQVMRLRKKIIKATEGRDLIQTVRGEGYGLVRGDE
jgi:DNA-binding response OmpR family regulator